MEKFVSSAKGALMAGIILFIVKSAGSKQWERPSGRERVKVCQKEHKVEDLFCSCLFPEKYQGASGIWYCGKCGGITDQYDARKADEVDGLVSYALFGNAFLSCTSCKNITWTMNDNHWEDQIRSHKMVYCPACGAKHNTRGMLK